MPACGHAVMCPPIKVLGCIELIAFCTAAKLAGLFLKTMLVKQQTGGKICAEIGFGKKFAQTENKPEIVAPGKCSLHRPNFTVRKWQYLFKIGVNTGETLKTRNF